ncbi:hypothetical protein WR25_12674 [Diploscapter pachys]|uniref:Uncharacterized protein n=1 Tax=Diploscapter pachys TaxID=2018661 RepID=A0A2A2LCK7_9BILA|nr:hypothetical protein WR25_12674 [Diploscapter pachys]
MLYVAVLWHLKIRKLILFQSQILPHLKVANELFEILKKYYEDSSDGVKHFFDELFNAAGHMRSFADKSYEDKLKEADDIIKIYKENEDDVNDVFSKFAEEALKMIQEQMSSRGERYGSQQYQPQEEEESGGGFFGRKRRSIFVF